MAYLIRQDDTCLMTLGSYQNPSDTGADPKALENHLGYLTIQRMAGPFNKPTRVVQAENGELFASDGYGNAAIHHFTHEGELLHSWGGPGMEPGHFNIPHSLDIDSQGRIWVADRDNNRVQIFDAEGKLIHVINGIAYAGDVWIGNKMAYIAEMEGRVSAFDMEFNLVAQFLYYASGMTPHALAGDSKENLYLGNFNHYNLVEWERL